MLTGDTKSTDFAQRARLRARSVWTPLLGNTPLSEDEGLLNALFQNSIESFLTVTDEIYAVKEDQRNREIRQSQAEVDQEYFLAQAKADTERQKLALKIAADNYWNDARVYDAQVRNIIMAAKEYLGQIEAEQIQVEAQHQKLAVQKEEIHLQDLNVKITVEEIQKAMVQADVAKNKLEVSKAAVRAVLADIEAQKSEIETINAQVQEAMTTVEKATLQAEIAMLLTEVIIKQLSGIKLSVEQESLNDSFNFIQQKLTDMLSLFEVKDRVEKLKEKEATDILDEVMSLLNTEKIGNDINLAQQANNAISALQYNKYFRDPGLYIVYQESEVEANIQNLELDLEADRSAMKISVSDKEAWAKSLLADVQAAVYGNRQITRSTNQIIHKHIGTEG